MNGRKLFFALPVICAGGLMVSLVGDPVVSLVWMVGMIVSIFLAIFVQESHTKKRG